MPRYLLGVDDADSLKSPTTGELLRGLAELLHTERLAEPAGVTRHQLLAKKPIRYTAHNSAVCMSVDAADMEAVWETARDYLSLRSVRHSNMGLCIGRWEGISREVTDWGRRAKAEVLTSEEAQHVAGRSHIRLLGVKGEGNGVIGALAAVGLRREGNDGRFLWLPGLLDLRGTCSVGDILERTTIDRVCSVEEQDLVLGDIVDLGEWARPILRNGQATLYVEQKKHGWTVLEKDRVKELSS